MFDWPSTRFSDILLLLRVPYVRRYVSCAYVFIMSGWCATTKMITLYGILLSHCWFLGWLLYIHNQRMYELQFSCSLQQQTTDDYIDSHYYYADWCGWKYHHHNPANVRSNLKSEQSERKGNDIDKKNNIFFLYLYLFCVHFISPHTDEIFHAVHKHFCTATPK